MLGNISLSYSCPFYLDYDAEEMRQSGEEMDERRREQIAYEYLCHLEEAKL